MQNETTQHVENQFIFEAGSITTIIKGGTFNAPVYTCPQSDSASCNPSVTSSKSTPSSEPKSEVNVPLTTLDRIIIAIQSVVDEGLILYKQDWAAVYRIVWEKWLPELKKSEFCAFVAERVRMEDRIVPNGGIIRRQVFSDAESHGFPNWKITGCGVRSTERYVGIARRVLEKME